MAKIDSAHDLEALAGTLARQRTQFKTVVTVCGGTGCKASRANAVIEALRGEVRSRKLQGTVAVRVTACHGFCEQGPIVVIDPGAIFYCHVTPQDVPEIFEKTVRTGDIVDRLLYTDPVSGQKVRSENDIPFYRLQDRRVLAQNRLVDPLSITDYIALGGYGALARVLSDGRPASVIAAVTGSGLRGRGGGGFPTGRKWEATRDAAGDEKYVICNADEGDPGAYMDRSILEGNPHLVLEGMLIGAYAVGAQRGYLYVRKEYPLAVEHARTAVSQAREYGLLGEGILGSGFSFDVDIARGGGAFVCGESTALMASLEGRVGEPRPKDVHTAVDGLWHKPTVLNNVETWANIPLIIKHGAPWFAAKGANGSTGTKIFALTGRVRNTGLIEVAMGTPISTIVYDIGGGSSNGTAIKAVQTGGPSGGCLPAEKFDMTVDFDTLAEAGSMVGSGGLVVMDEKTCMVDVARYFLKFLGEESCGKCVPCRVGVSRMLELVTDIAEGRGTLRHLELLAELGETVKETSLCALGKTAPNPVLSTLRYFREEYEAHIRDHECPAGVCRSLITYSIDPEKCTGCGACIKACPRGSITGEKKRPHVITATVCDKCGICAATCKFDAVVLN